MMSRQTDRDRVSVARNIGLWALQILTAVAFLAAGYAKLSGQPTMVATFDKIGAGPWFRYVTGVVEGRVGDPAPDPPPGARGRVAARLHDDRGRPGASPEARRLAAAGHRPRRLRRDHPVGPTPDSEGVARPAVRPGTAGASYDAQPLLAITAPAAITPKILPGVIDCESLAMRAMTATWASSVLFTSALSPPRPRARVEA